MSQPADAPVGLIGCGDGRALALARVAEIRVHGGSGHAEQVGDLLDRVAFVFFVV
jgi:hypothetical protein